MSQPTNETPKVAKEWSLLFGTGNGMTHPLRISYDSPQPESKARKYADEYLAENSDWLTSISDVYPTDLDSLKGAKG